MSETIDLKLSDLRAANVARLPLFKNRRGETAHSQPDGSDWCLAQWCNAVTGELGEAANLIKKIERGDVTLDEARSDLAKELADVQTYLDILAFRAGVNLGEATISKFNEVSVRVGCDVRLAPAGTREPGPDWVCECGWTNYAIRHQCRHCNKQKTASPAPAAPQPDRGESKREDLLDMVYINSLPQPFIGRELGGSEWPIEDFEVETGLIRIDVCGKLQVKSISDFTAFRDGDGVVHSADAFYSDATLAKHAAPPKDNAGESAGSAASAGGGGEGVGNG